MVILYVQSALHCSIPSRMAAIQIIVRFVAEERKCPAVRPITLEKSHRKGGHSVAVTVTDRCTGCAEFDLDLSPAAFSQLASESTGR